MAQSEVPAALNTQAIDVALHDGPDFWSNLKTLFKSTSLDVSNLFEVPVLQAKVKADGTLKKIKYLNATETPGTDSDDRVIGSQKNDLVTVGDGNDTVVGKGGADRLDGGREMTICREAMETTSSSGARERTSWMGAPGTTRCRAVGATTSCGVVTVKVHPT